MQNPIVKGQYGRPLTNPIFEVFYLDNAHGSNRRLSPETHRIEF